MRPRDRRRAAAAGAILLLVAVIAAVLFVAGRRSRRSTAGADAPPDRGFSPPQPDGEAGRGASPSGRRISRAPLALSTATRGREPEVDHAGGSLQGRVVSAEGGRGIAGASLTFVHDGATSGTVTGADGGFVFVPPAPGTYDLAAVTAEGYFAFAPEIGQSPIAFAARAGVRVRDVVLTLRPRVLYTGVVRDPGGRGIEGAVVRVRDAAEGADGFTTDARGEFRFAAADGAVLEARHPRFATARGVVDFGAQVSRRVALTMSPRSADAGDTAEDGAIAGRVVLADGTPVDGAQVSARMEVPGEDPAAVRPLEIDLRPEGRAVSGADGRFAMERLERGRYTVVARARGLTSATAEHVATGSSELVLRLAAGARVRGTVRDAATQRPVAGFTVVLAPLRGPVERGPAITASVFDAEGRYEVTGLAPGGSYVVSAVAHGYAPSVEVTVVAGPAAQADFVLGRGGRVTGRVTDAGTHAPLAGARVVVERLIGEDRSGGGADAVPTAAPVVTDAAGRFELRGLSPGLHSVLASAEGHHGRLISNLRVEAGGDVGPIAIELTPTREGEDPRIELVGIGAVLGARGDALVIGRVLPGGGAAAAGLVEGDGILAVDGEGVVPLGFAGAVERIRGPEGSTVRLTVRRAGDGGAVIVVDVVRRRVQS